MIKFIFSAEQYLPLLCVDCVIIMSTMRNQEPKKMNVFYAFVLLGRFVCFSMFDWYMYTILVSVEGHVLNGVFAGML